MAAATPTVWAVANTAMPKSAARTAASTVSRSPRLAHHHRRRPPPQARRAVLPQSSGSGAESPTTTSARRRRRCRRRRTRSAPRMTAHAPRAALEQAPACPAASRVDLPEPGTPVTSVRPRHRSQAAAISASMPNSSRVGGAVGQNPHGEVDAEALVRPAPARGCSGSGGTAAGSRGHRIGAVDGFSRAQDAVCGAATRRGVATRRGASIGRDVVEDARAEPAHDDAVEARAGGAVQDAVHLDEGGGAGLEGDVGGAEIGRPQQEAVQACGREGVIGVRPATVHWVSPSEEVCPPAGV